MLRQLEERPRGSARIPVDPLLLAPLFGLAAFLYASVGHGGATAYWAILSLAGFALAPLTPTVLVLNVLVAGTAFLVFRQSGHLRPELLLPFVLTSVPAAYFGGRAPLSAGAVDLIIGGTLLLAGVRLLAFAKPPSFDLPRSRAVLWTAGPLLGAGLGFLAGATGIGGGVFLSPLLLLAGWANVREAASVSAAFIVLNSAAGLAAKLPSQGIDLALLLPLAAAAVAGGLLGSLAGAKRLELRSLQVLLGVVLLVAAAKTLL